MKINLALLATLATAALIGNATASEGDSCCANKGKHALSPRAALNETVVVCGKSDGLTASSALGTGARVKSLGNVSTSMAGNAAKDVDLARGQSNLGVAAKEKATGNRATSTFQIAPLK